MSVTKNFGWDSLRHGGLLLDPQRVARIADSIPSPLSPQLEQELRRQASGILEGSPDSADIPEFVSFVLKRVCGFSDETGTWQRGPQIGSDWTRRAVTGEAVKPRQLWRGCEAGTMPVFIDSESRLGQGRGRRAVSQIHQWLRSGTERLALLTNGRQWRLVFAGLDFDAWCEWDIDLWFEQGVLSPQIVALRTLFAPALWIPPSKDAVALLLQAVLDSRKGQAELSAVLGERVREAVEILVQAHSEVIKEKCSDVEPAEIYRAAVRIVMRLVVSLFAESRDLLPRDVPLYHEGYGVAGLLEELEKTAARGGNRLARSWSAWPRVLALFRLIHSGSHHEALSVPAYGGELFSPGDCDAADGLSRALAVFETACFELEREVMSDRNVYELLTLLTRTQIKVRQGRAGTWITAPVDFSDFSSEYIGILYEGLLDFELKTAEEGDPVIFLAVGQEPALPLSRLEKMDEKALASLLEKMKNTREDEAGESDGENGEPSDVLSEEEQVDAEEQGEEGEEPATESCADISEPPSVGSNDERRTVRTRAETWARKAVSAAKLVPKLRGALTPEKRLAHDQAVGRMAARLVSRVVLPGEHYLVRWGGTRKGAGTFYTRPGLAVPTVHRTLRPLAYNAPLDADGKPNFGASPSTWTPKKPEEILALKVCDPACGSGTFPVAALRFLTEAVYEALHAHGRLAGDIGRPLDEILGLATSPDNSESIRAFRLPCRPGDDDFEKKTKAIIRRYVVERSIYGVDIDPLAVELCRLSLWIETMDRTLPFSFLDHKIKCGNSLIGAWFDQFRHYPVMAWKNREGGDKNHTNGVHFSKEVRTRAIKAFVKDMLVPDLGRFLSNFALFPEGFLEKAEAAHEEALAVLSRLHEFPIHETAERARLYRETFLGSEAYRSLKTAMDLWCACWFWPADELDKAPMPTTLFSPAPDTLSVAEGIARKKCFFHWELEFPDVFRAAGSGFDAMLGNPPWDIAKPNSKEFFSNTDPLYRSYRKQEALRFQAEYFQDIKVERAWLDYNADFRARSNYMSYSASPYGDPSCLENSQDRFTIVRGKDNETVHERWRQARKGSSGYVDPKHPFRYQGSADLNLYKLFVEQAYVLLCPGRRLGFIVPSGIYSDDGTRELRTLLLEHSQWEWLFGFVNSEKIFPIASNQKFNPIIIEKGTETTSFHAAFMRQKMDDWGTEIAETMRYSRRNAERFSPYSKAILEVRSKKDLEILEKIYDNSKPLCDSAQMGTSIKFTTDFHMTNDSRLFHPISWWEAQNYRPDEYGRWIKGDWRDRSQNSPAPANVGRIDIAPGIILSRDSSAWIEEGHIEKIALPLYQGTMVGNFDGARKRWLHGTGLGAKWEFIPYEQKQLCPQFLISSTEWTSPPEGRIGFRDVARSTEKRTMTAAVLASCPAGNKVPVLLVDRDYLALSAIMNSFAFDWHLRRRVTAANINWFILAECGLPRGNRLLIDKLSELAARLTCIGPYYSVEWVKLGLSISENPWALTTASRLELLVQLDVLSAALYGLDSDGMRHILKDVDLPALELSSRRVPSRLDPEGFWRIDKDVDPELRHSVLTLVAFRDFERSTKESGGDREKGMEGFCTQNEGQGWLLPESVRLSDYGLGRDSRSKESQPVKSRFGPRLCDWQLKEGGDRFSAICHLHARNMLGEVKYQQLITDLKREQPKPISENDDQGLSPMRDESSKQGKLFR